MATQAWAVFLVVFCTVLTSTAQVFLKFGAVRLPEVVTNLPLMVGFVLYGVAALALIVSFRGGEVTVLYPIIATSYVWVTVLSWVYFNEVLSVLKVGGVFSIVLGICCIGWASRSSSDYAGVV